MYLKAQKKSITRIDKNHATDQHYSKFHDKLMKFGGLRINVSNFKDCTYYNTAGKNPNEIKNIVLKACESMAQIKLYCGSLWTDKE